MTCALQHRDRLGGTVEQARLTGLGGLMKAGHREGKAAGRAAGPRGVRSSPGASVCGGGSRCPGGNGLDELVWARRTVEGRPLEREGWPEQRTGASCWAHPASQSWEESTRPPFDGWENHGSRGRELPRSAQPVSQDLGVKPGFSDHRRMNGRQRGIKSKAPSTGEPNGIPAPAAGAPCSCRSGGGSGGGREV